LGSLRHSNFLFYNTASARSSVGKAVIPCALTTFTYLQLQHSNIPVYFAEIKLIVYEDV